MVQSNTIWYNAIRCPEDEVTLISIRVYLYHMYATKSRFILVQFPLGPNCIHWLYFDSDLYVYVHFTSDKVVNKIQHNTTAHLSGMRRLNEKCLHGLFLDPGIPVSAVAWLHLILAIQLLQRGLGDVNPPTQTQIQSQKQNNQEITSHQVNHKTNQA